MIIVDPIRKFVNVRNGAQEVLKVRCATANYGVGNGQTVIAADATKLHRVVGIAMRSGFLGNTTYTFRNGAGGTLLYQSALLSGGNGEILPITDTGYFETLAVNTALVVDVGTTGVYANVFYVTYTP